MPNIFQIKTAKHFLMLCLISSTGLAQSYLGPYDPSEKFANIQSYARLKAQNPANKPVYVQLKSGTYTITEMLNFNNEDSGVIYEAMPGHFPVISAGTKLSNGWSVFDSQRNIWVYTLSDHEKPQYNVFRNLYVNGTSAIRSREPNVGTENKMPTVQPSRGGFQVVVPPHLINAELSKTNPIDIIVHETFTTDILGIRQFNLAGRMAVIAKPFNSSLGDTRSDWGDFASKKTGTAIDANGDSVDLQKIYLFGGMPYHFENSIDFIDAPGEWYYDRDASKLYYKPNPWEVTNGALNAEFIVPKISNSSMININGSSNLIFDGITFSHVDWIQPSLSGYIFDQAQFGMPSAIAISNSKSVKIQNCKISNIGSGAIEFSGANANCELTESIIENCSGWGVKIGPDGHNNVITVKNNYITKIGTSYRGSYGIFIANTTGSIVEHNELSNMPYSGMCVGWAPGPGDLPVLNSYIRYNKIHDVMQELADGGGIYTLKTISGTYITGNYIYNIWPGKYSRYNSEPEYHINKVYADNKTTGAIIFDNYGGPADLGDVGNEAVMQSGSNAVIPANQVLIDRYLFSYIPTDSGIEAGKLTKFSYNLGHSIASVWGLSVNGALGSSFGTSIGTAPADYMVSQFLGTPNVDYPAYIASKSLELGNSSIDFGGAYGYVNGQPTINPVTNTCGCPSGFTPVQVLGSYGKDYPIFFCLRPASNAPGSVLFGGIWGLSPGFGIRTYINGLYRNPVTGGAFAPRGFNTNQILGTSGVDYPVWFAWRPKP